MIASSAGEHRGGEHRGSYVNDTPSTGSRHRKVALRVWFTAVREPGAHQDALFAFGRTHPARVGPTVKTWNQAILEKGRGAVPAGRSLGRYLFDRVRPPAGLLHLTFRQTAYVSLLAARQFRW